MVELLQVAVENAAELVQAAIDITVVLVQRVGTVILSLFRPSSGLL